MLRAARAPLVTRYYENELMRASLNENRRASRRCMNETHLCGVQVRCRVSAILQQTAVISQPPDSLDDGSQEELYLVGTCDCADCVAYCGTYCGPVLPPRSLPHNDGCRHGYRTGTGSESAIRIHCVMRPRCAKPLPPQRTRPAANRAWRVLQDPKEDQLVTGSLEMPGPRAISGQLAVAAHPLVDSQAGERSIEESRDN